MIARRQFLKGLGLTGLSTLSLGTQITSAFSQGLAYGINAETEGLRPDSSDNQGKRLQQILEKASQSNTPVFLPPGRYIVSDVVMPKNTRLLGIKGASILQHAGGGHFLWSEKANHVSLKGLTLDGALMPTQEYAGSALRIMDAKRAFVEDCHITNSSRSGLQIERSEGRVVNNRIDTAVGVAGIFAVENKGLSIEGNLVEECANAGILVHRYGKGADNSIVANNRVRNISAVAGGTGQYGNGINMANADGVIVTGNHISNCAYSAVRAFSCANVQITNNNCFNSGETAIYSEFNHQGALISNNLIDGGVRGVSMANLNEGGRLSVCSNNMIRNIHANAPYPDDQHVFGNGISAEADTAITGNVIENAINYGILLGWGDYLRNISASGNVIRGTKYGFYVSVVKGVGPVSITGNSFSEISRGGIVGFQWKDAITGDLARTGVGKYTNITVADNALNY